MAKKDSDLFERLRQAGLRKQAAKTLSEIGEGASKKALRTAHGAVSELRALADELERLPRATPDASTSRRTAAGSGTRPRAATPRATTPPASRSRATSGRTAAKQPPAQGSARGTSEAKPARRAATGGTRGTGSPRGRGRPASS